MHNFSRRLAIVVASSVLTAVPHVASAQTWSMWNSSMGGNDASGTVSGTLLGSSITYTGVFLNFDGTSAAPNFWQGANLVQNGSQAAYSQNGVTAPTNSSLIRFNVQGGGKISFGSAVVNPFMAFNSIGQSGRPVTYDFGTSAFNVVSDNTSLPAYWSTGSHSVLGNALTGTEFSGVIKFLGTFSEIDFTTNAPENWHAITVGAESAGSVVPEPSTYALMATGLAGLFSVARRRRQVR
jgi:hypothetical protein